MSSLVSVTLTGPAKIGGQRKPAGATVSVSTTLALQLAASGVINPELAKSLAEAVQDTPLASDFQAAVDVAVAERIAEHESEAAHELAAAQRRIAELDKETENLTADLADAMTRVGKAEALVADLEKQLAAALSTPAEDDAENKPAAKTAKATK